LSPVCFLSLFAFGFLGRAASFSWRLPCCLLAFASEPACSASPKRSRVHALMAESASCQVLQPPARHGTQQSKQRSSLATRSQLTSNGPEINARAGQPTFARPPELLPASNMSRSRTLRATMRDVILSGLSLALSGCVGQPAPSVANRAAASAPGVPEAPSLDPSAPAEPGKLELDLALRHQRLEGFGASIAWYQERVVGRTHEDLYQLLFPELGLDILRLRNRFERSEQSDANLKQEQEIVERASRALGRRPRLMLSAWSPPALLKANGREKCQSN